MANALHYVRQQQTVDGTRSCYWWHGSGHATFHALRTLALGGMLPAGPLSAAARATRKTQNADGTWGTSFASETAMTLHALQLIAHLDDSETPAIVHGHETLAAMQKQDGSFPPSPILRIPPPTAMRPHEVQE